MASIKVLRNRKQTPAQRAARAALIAEIGREIDQKAAEQEANRRRFAEVYAERQARKERKV